MKLWIGGEIQADIADSFRMARKTVEGLINNSLDQKKYALNLKAWDCIAVIKDDSDFDEIVKYSPKKKEMDFRLKINYQEFKEGSNKIREKLIFNMLQRSLKLLKEKGFTDEEIDPLIIDVEQVGNKNY